jgi:hypothetical protein
MHRHLKLFMALALISGCATVPDKEAFLPAQGAACIEQRPTLDGKPSVVVWCIASQIFQPRKYSVAVDGKTVFEGTDYTRVKFTAALDGRPVAGQCEEHVTLLDTKANAPMALAAIPKTTVDACAIGATADGRSMRFLKSEPCDVHFYKDLAALIGPIIPVENMRRCTLQVRDQRVFDGTFHTARRF